MELDSLPAPLQSVLTALAGAIRTREPAIRARVERLRSENPDLSTDELAGKLMRSTRLRVAATGAAGGASAVIPVLGTAVAIGTAAGQSLYALEQEAELVMAIAILYGHELSGSDERVLEALVVVGIAGGAVKLRDNVLVAGGHRITVAAFRQLPQHFVGRAGGGFFAGLLGKLAAGRALRSAARVAPLAVGVAAGAGFDWFAVTAIGKAAIRYYAPGGPASRALPSGASGSAAMPPAGPSIPARNLPAQDLPEVEPGH